jgi:DNA invertase Pin-like site-specific DNA recombinase
MKAVLYVRVSTTAQAQDGVGLDAQLAKLNQWATLHDAEVIGSFADEGISGSVEDRPGLESAIALACREKAALCVYSLSRLSRSITHTIAVADRLSKAECDLVSLTEQIDSSSAAGRMIFRLLATFNQFERELAAERTKAALTFKRSQGERVGNVLYGFTLADDGVKLIPDHVQQEAIRLIKALREDGMSFREIAAELNARNVPTQKGKPWIHTAVARIVKRAA